MWKATAAVAAVFVAAMAATPVAAQQGVWPTKQITIVVPFAAGSTPDLMARFLAEGLQKRHGQVAIVENRPGAGGNIGTGAIAKAEPDGHTIGISILGPLVVNPMIMRTVPYNAEKDITPISQIATQPGALVVPASLGIEKIEDLIARLKAEPDKLNYGSIGVGSVSHLAMALIAKKVGAKPVHVPFAGSPPAITALLRSDVQMAVLPIGAVGEQVKEGKLKLLAVTTAKRSQFFPDVPTLIENGLDGVEADAWTGFIGPAGLKPEVLAAISASVRDVMTAPDVTEKLRAQYIETVGSTPDAFKKLLDDER
ncbi:MAG: hypothetical protein RL291_433, partial [Pseudomonadota bacterium]